MILYICKRIFIHWSLLILLFTGIISFKSLISVLSTNAIKIQQLIPLIRDTGAFDPCINNLFYQGTKTKWLSEWVLSVGENLDEHNGRSEREGGGRGGIIAACRGIILSG